MAGHSQDVAIQLAAVLALVNWIFTLGGTFFVDKSGRRGLALVSSIGVTISLFFIAYISYCLYSNSMDTLGQSITDLGFPYNAECAKYTKCYECTFDNNCGFLRANEDSEYYNMEYYRRNYIAWNCSGFYHFQSFFLRFIYSGFLNYFIYRDR